MIEGTKTYRKKNASLNVAAPSATPQNSTSFTCEASSEKPLEEIYPSTQTSDPLKKTSLDAPNPSRRDWFQSLVPAFGSGLVKILRESNHLRRELSDIMHTQNDPDKK